MEANDGMEKKEDAVELTEQKPASERLFKTKFIFVLAMELLRSLMSNAPVTENRSQSRPSNLSKEGIVRVSQL